MGLTRTRENNTKVKSCHHHQGDLGYNKSKRTKFEIKQYLRFEIKDGGGLNVSSNPNFTPVFVNDFVLAMYVVVIHL